MVLIGAFYYGKYTFWEIYFFDFFQPETRVRFGHSPVYVKRVDPTHGQQLVKQKKRPSISLGRAPSARASGPRERAVARTWWRRQRPSQRGGWRPRSALQEGRARALDRTQPLAHPPPSSRTKRKSIVCCKRLVALWYQAMAY